MTSGRIRVLHLEKDDDLNSPVEEHHLADHTVATARLANNNATRGADAEITQSRRRPWRAVAVALALTAAIAAVTAAIAVSSRKPDNQPASPAIGQLVPDLIGNTIDGTPFDINDLRGRWVLINLFATWCVPCQVEHPELVALDEEHKGSKDVQLISVVYGDSDSAVSEFFAERGGDWPVLGQEYSTLIVELGAAGLPETFVVNPQGQIVDRILGGATQQSLNDIIETHSS